jgi:uncharacterized damage-inducible protein DinB
MNAELAVFHQLLNQTMQSWLTLLEPLSEEALDARPIADGNSLRVLAAHTLGATRFLVIDIAKGTPDPQRDRTAEFQATTNTHSKAALLEGLAALAQGAANLDPNRLEADQAAPSGRLFNVRWALWHGLLHARQHLGQAQMLVKLI